MLKKLILRLEDVRFTTPPMNLSKSNLCSSELKEHLVPTYYWYYIYELIYAFYLITIRDYELNIYESMRSIVVH